MHRTLALTLFLLLLQASAPAFADIVVAAASSIRVPLDDLISQYKEDSPASIKVVYGSSGSLTHQIIRGAPFHIFLSADTAFPEKLWGMGFSEQKPVPYAVGSIEIYASRSSSCVPENGLRGIAEALNAGSIRKVAIANPELAPYGRAARQAMEQQGLWKIIEPYLVYGNNVGQAAQFAFTGSVDCAILSRSYTYMEGLASSGRSYPVLPDQYTPVLHAMVLLNQSDPAILDLFEYFGSEDATLAFLDAGFSLVTAD